jgi:chromosomal replication initiator protein
VVAELRARGQQPSGAWTRILGHLELKLNPHSFATWMRPTEELGVLTDGEGDRLVIVVPNDTFRTWITRNYREAIDEACQAAGVTAGLTFVTRDEVEAG